LPGLPFINDTFTESSATTTLTVQETQIESAYPPNPLPTEYWQRPINSMNRNWFSLGGNWLGLGGGQFGNTGLYDANNGGRTRGNFNPYTTAPNSAHVLWTKPVAFGGQIGGEFGDSETSLYATGTAYENKFGAVILNGIVYYTQYPGAATNFGPLTAVDLRTGQTLWTVNASNPLRCGMVYNFITGDQYGGHAYLFTGPAGYGQGFIIGGTPNVWSMQYILADGKLYVRSGHDYTPPVFKGAKLYCLNATNGDLVWDSLSFNIISSPACADGYMLWFNGYDSQVYCYGKGPSATTISIQNDVTTYGNKVLVKGMVTDESPGTKEYAQTARFPHGVPAISDESMSSWMEYLYQQQPLPQGATGVNVTITVLDPNNNCYDVATATSDADGFFSATFVPQVPGKYTVYATFTGSESYYGSHAMTAISVEETPAATPAPTPQPASLADIYFLPMSIVILIVVIVATVVIVLMLRKR
jgi:hypothetical protein